MKHAQTAGEVFLRPGELWFGDGRTRVRTVLGSCVAVTLWHPHRRIGGMCHYMLPSRGSRDAKELDGRYGDEALEMLLKAIQLNKGHPIEFEAKLFGGGYMFDRTSCPRQDCSSHIQGRNISASRELMARHGLKVKAEHLGGHGHRQVIFDASTGHVWMKHTPLAAAQRGRTDADDGIHPLIERGS